MTLTKLGSHSKTLTARKARKESRWALEKPAPYWDLLHEKAFRKGIQMLSSAKVPPFPSSPACLFKTDFFMIQIFVELTPQRASLDHLILKDLQSVVSCTRLTLSQCLSQLIICLDCTIHEYLDCMAHMVSQCPSLNLIQMFTVNSSWMNE